MQDYRRLHVWRRAHAQTLSVRRVADQIRKKGYSTFKAQITRSAESVPYNIVEGCGAQTRKEFARFLDISIKSTTELEYQLFLGRDYQLFAVQTWSVLTEETIEIRKMLYRLRAKVLEADEEEEKGQDGESKDDESGNAS